jgi:peptidyl-dipeptidase A
MVAYRRENMIRTVAPALALVLALAATPALAERKEKAPPPVAEKVGPSVADADAFVAAAEKEEADFSPFAQSSEWISETYIGVDSDVLNTRIQSDYTAMQVRLAKQAAKYQGLPGLSFDTARKLNILRSSITLPAPDAPGAGTELAAIETRLTGTYGKGRGSRKGAEINGSDIEAAMGSERDPVVLKEMWTSWHDNVGTPMKPDYVRMVEIANKGAQDLGFKDVGAMWRSRYDMPPDQFALLMDKLWKQVQPLYVQLHCYVRAKLNAKYGDAVQKASGPIRADLLGNMWAQEWGNVYDVVAPKGAGDIGYDLTALLKAKQYDPLKMVKTAEGFYTSLGFDPLPDTFWTRSQITKPRDREVVCHASAWDLDNKDDLRVKTCLKVVADDFVTIHHELGHNFYQRAYNKQPYLYMDGANDGFHEAIGDFIALSTTPDYLVKLNLLDPAKVPGEDKDIGLLLRQAMDKVAFLPFGLMVDKWRWGVFDGTFKPADYEDAWNALRLQYQGVVPPVDRSGDAFDPGAKFHIPGNTPYARYFLARVLQFQFFKAACEQAGWKGPLHRCDFYGNKEVGAKLNAMLAMGQSKPWPDALEAFTGSRDIDGEAMTAYFAPLMTWLQEQNKDRQCGW